MIVRACFFVGASLSGALTQEHRVTEDGNRHHQGVLQAGRTLAAAPLYIISAALSYLTIWDCPHVVGRQACPQNGVLLAGVGNADHLHSRVILLDKVACYSMLWQQLVSDELFSHTKITVAAKTI